MRFVDLVGDLLDHRDYVTHTEDTVGHSIRMELGEILHFFPFTDVFDRLAGDGTHRERGSTTSVTIELSQNEAGNADFFVEGLSD